MGSHVWRVDVGEQTFLQEEVPEAWQRLGGRALLARILLDEVPGGCDPLGRHNKLIWAPGLLGGQRLTSCDRISIGAKSPLTGGIKESNAGGTTAYALSCLGIHALILEGMPAQAGLWLLYLDGNGVRFERADDLQGLGAYATAKILIERFGSKVGISLIGPSGERGAHAAGILNLDKEGDPSRISARGGLGAVMGSKGVKAIVIDAANVERPAVADPGRYKQAKKAFMAALMAHPQIQAYADYGTAAMTAMSDGFGGIPTRNFSSGVFEEAEAIGGDRMRELLLARGGAANTTHACMPGCVIRCSNCFADAEGKKVVSPVEYETIGLLGSNLGIDDLDTVAQMNAALNDMGLDTIEIGAALGVAAEAGFMTFGNRGEALALVDQIRTATPLGRVLEQGAQMTGTVFNIRRVPVVKGQALSAYDPRAIKGTGVTYATSPQGADHTAGLTIRAKINHLDPKGQAELSRAAQINMAGYDSLGACIFAGFGFGTVPEALREILYGQYGWDPGESVLQDLGRECLRMERAFNAAAGMGPEDDRLPEWMEEEPLPPHNTVFDVPDDELDRIFEGL